MDRLRGLGIKSQWHPLLKGIGFPMIKVPSEAAANDNAVSVDDMLSAKVTEAYQQRVFELPTLGLFPTRRHEHASEKPERAG